MKLPGATADAAFAPVCFFASKWQLVNGTPGQPGQVSKKVFEN
jgi:hypothetical protein